MNARNEYIRSIVRSFENLIASIDTHHYPELSDDYIDHSENLNFDDVPVSLRVWIQSQGGLRIQGLPVTDRESLERTFALLDKGRTSYLGGVSSEYLAQMLGILYIQKITRNQSNFKQTKTIPGEPGKIIFRKCSCCQKPVLDDSIPCFVAESPEIYVVEIVRISQKGGSGCGQLGCEGKPALIPVDRMTQLYTRLEKRAIARTQKARATTSWKTPLCRAGKDLDDCAHSVRVRCRGSGKGNQKVQCGRERVYDMPEWTIHTPPRLVQPRLKCDCDGRTKDHYFEPVDKHIEMVLLTNLRKVYKGFLDIGCDLADYPKLPHVIFNLGSDGRPRKEARSYQTRYEELKRAREALANT